MTSTTKRTKPNPREVTRLATLERRKGSEQLRWSLDEFVTESGVRTAYVSARKWFLDREGNWRPTKSGLTIRASELPKVVEALQRAQHHSNDTHD